MTSASDNSLVLYDIATRPPVEKTCCSPNPWKARLALNFKGVPYSTKWVAIPDIPKVRSGLKVPATRKFADGSDFYTLPVVVDPSTNTLLGDSFDIAAYLQKTYPESGAGDLFPSQTLDFEFENSGILVPLSDCRESEYPDYAKFNVHVDAAFTTHVLLTTEGFPFDPASEQATKEEFMRRAGTTRFEQFFMSPEAREQTMESFKTMLGNLGKLYQRDTSGPFLLGTKPSYADMIVGAWLRMMSRTMPEKDWEKVAGWHDGIFGQLHEALDAYAQVK